MTNVPPGQRFVPPSLRPEASSVVDKSLPGIQHGHAPRPAHFPNNPISLEIHMRVKLKTDIILNYRTNF